MGPQEGDSVFPSSLNRVFFELSLEGTTVLPNIALGSRGLLGGYFVSTKYVLTDTCLHGFSNFPFFIPIKQQLQESLFKDVS